MFLIDELTVTLRIGQKYTFIGIVRRDSYSDKMITAIEVPRSLPRMKIFISLFLSVYQYVYVNFYSLAG